MKDLSTRKNVRFDARLIATTAVLIAASIVWIVFMPPVDLVIWSGTLFSHLFIFIAMYLNPVSGILTAIGTVCAFWFKGMAPVVIVRAASHIVFVLVGILMLKKMNIKKPVNMVIFLIVTAIIHGLAETLCVYAFIWSGAIPTQGVGYIWGTTFGLTVAHSVLDAVVAFILAKVLEKAKVCRMEAFHIGAGKEKHTEHVG